MSLRPVEEEFLTPRQRRRVLELVQSRFGIRDSDYGASRIDTAVQRVLPTAGYPDFESLIASLTPEAMPRWLFELVEHLTVGETYFLRDPAQITALRETV